MLSLLARLQARENIRTPRVIVWLLLAYCGLVACLGLVYLPAPLSSDESLYYLPAIGTFAEAAPAFPVHDYRMPNPPAALVLQAITHRLTDGSISATRALSAVSSLVLGIHVVLLLARNTASRFDLLLSTAYLLCFPTLLNGAFILKHHVFSLTGLVGGFYWLTHPQRNWPRIAFATLGFSFAALSSQAAVPFILLLLVLEAWHQWTEPAHRSAVPFVALAVPLAALTALFVIWGGIQPPSYKDVLLQSRLGLLAWNPKQTLLCLYSVGLWLIPLNRLLDRRGLVLGAPILILMIAFAHSTGMMRTDSGAFENVVGPTTTLLRSILPNQYIFHVLIFSVPLALGVVFVCGEVREGGWFGPLLYIVLFWGLMSSVPYLFESYYVYLVTPAIAWQSARLLQAASRPGRASFMVLAALMGLSYTIVKGYRLVVFGVG